MGRVEEKRKITLFRVMVLLREQASESMWGGGIRNAGSERSRVRTEARVSIDV